ncbi:MAG: hypothetical protein HY904_05235 [Deltaproteobacteria bacterium]|nr:hypothetical protein [Deltaproteobacteria bacterium]
MSKSRAWLVGCVVAVGSAAACGGISLFTGRINNAFYEPTGTLFAWGDQLSPAPQLASNPQTRFVVGGVYAYFDPAQDQAGALNGSDRAELIQEIVQNDWLALQWANDNDVEPGKSFTAVLLRTTDEPFFRVPDPSSSDNTAGFTARVGFRRPATRRNASYKCPTYLPPPLCMPVRSFGSRARVEVSVNDANRGLSGNIRLSVTVTVERTDTDASDAITGTVRGNISASVVSERVAEANMATLTLYDLFNVVP